MYHTSTVFKTALLLQVSYGIPLHFLGGRFLLQNIVDDAVGGIGANGVDYGEGEFTFSKVFAEAFERGVSRSGREVEVVVEDLEEDAYRGDERRAVTRGGVSIPVGHW